MADQLTPTAAFWMREFLEAGSLQERLNIDFALALGDKAYLWGRVRFASDAEIRRMLEAGWKPDWPPDPVFKPLAERVEALCASS